jgi:hypothetical protein
MRRSRTFAALAALTVVAATAGTAAAMTAVTAAPATGSAGGTVTGCQLGQPGAAVKHVIYLQFDNVHFTRDNPNVPSDLEQMPHLLNFLQSQGTLDDNHHTPLIAHTGTDILTSLTGVYGDKMGQPISNSYKYFTPSGVANTGVSFAYWTDGVYDPAPGGVQGDTAPTMVAPNGKVAPAPWVPYTRAGCDFGAVSTANTILENTGPDVPKVFGAGSPEAAEAADTTNHNLAQTDFVGIGVHCAQNSAVCATAGGNAKPDLLPDEPGGYTGYQGLFGAKYTNPAISPNGPVKDVSGANTIADPLGRPGFPGFDGMSAANTLGYVAQMQEAGVPVTYGYISDAHDNHSTVHAYGPGEAGYVGALQSYDTAFDQFFQRLNTDGINASNTMFVVTSDENDHFVGGKPSPANCDGVTTPCTYTQIGEINANAKGLLATQAGVTTPFAVHADSAPNYYLTGNPAAASPTVRTFEHAVAGLTATNPLTGNVEKFANYFADPVEEKLLHMVTADPLRTPTFTEFANPDYYVYAGAANCNAPCVSEPPAFAWNHGDFAPDINSTWAGFVGPSFQNLGVASSVWTDHADLRPTMFAGLGLTDDYIHDGVPIVQFLRPNAVPAGLHGTPVADLEAAYRQLNSCVGTFGTDTLKASTKGIESSTPGDAQYTATENALTALGQARDALAAQIQQTLDDAAFHGGHVNGAQAHLLTAGANALLASAHALSLV